MIPQVGGTVEPGGDKGTAIARTNLDTKNVQVGFRKDIVTKIRFVQKYLAHKINS